MGEIQALLARHGARMVLTEYDGKGTATGISFALDTAFGRQAFRMPANVEGIWRVMQRQGRDGKLQRRFVTEAQAQRVAWRILRQWLAAQLELIAAEMVRAEEILLPYLIVDRESRQTLYEAMIESRLQLPAPKEVRE